MEKLQISLLALLSVAVLFGFINAISVTASKVLRLPVKPTIIVTEEEATTSNINTNTNSTTTTPTTTATQSTSSSSSSQNSTSTQTPTSTQFQGNVSDQPGFKEAAELLLNSIDLDIDPCVDFYRFTCNNFIKTRLADGKKRTGCFAMLQGKVYSELKSTITQLDNPTSTALQTLKLVYDKCVDAITAKPEDKAEQLNTVMKDVIGGFPMLSPTWTEVSNSKFWTAVGTLELQYGISTFLSSHASVDEQNISRNALYISQLFLPMARHYFVRPEFISNLNNYRNRMISVVELFKNHTGSNVSSEIIQAETTRAIDLEIELATASLPDELRRNAKQLYNPFNISQLRYAFPSIGWENYLDSLIFDGQPSRDEYIVQMPTYVGYLDNIMAGNFYSQRTLVNYMMIRLLEDNMDYLRGGNDAYNDLYMLLQEYKGKSAYPRYSAKSCISLLVDKMPYAAGYLYVNSVSSTVRDKVRQDVGRQLDYIIDSFLDGVITLPWMTVASRNEAKFKADNIIKNIGWPNWYNFTDTTSLDQYHKYYYEISEKDDFWTIQNKLQYAYQMTESIGLLEEKPDRSDFLQSPAVVNAWYQPERNSITFPYAILNPPFYKLDFPKAFNYGGQGGTAGHELTHGFDDEGVQFNAYGELKPCDRNHCGWLDTNSTNGFNSMAQCVVTQYSEDCCPIKEGNVRCASGQRTQGENIADLGGTLAAYNAYRKYVSQKRQGIEEDRLPGLAQFSLNQIFWMSYAYSWCTNIDPTALRSQIMTNPHAPAVCRVNQVVRDIPQFGIDFNCKVGSPMYPPSDERCHVWSA